MLWKNAGHVRIKKTALSGSSHILKFCNENDDSCFLVKSMTLNDLDKIFKSKIKFNKYNIVVKIDTEGSEYEILKGSMEFIKKFNPYFVIEIHSRKAYRNVIKFLRSYGYDIKTSIHFISIFGKKIMYATIVYAFP